MSLYTEGMKSLGDIAKEFGYGKSTVRSRLLERGISFDKGPRISAKMKGRRSWRKGYKYTPEERAAVSKRMRGTKRCVGRKYSPATIEKMSVSAKQRWGKIPRVDPGVEVKRQKFKRILKSLLRAAKTKKQGRTATALGYSRDILVQHIEAQFQPGMSWADRKSFSIDHVVPVAEFIRRGIDNPQVVCALVNLRPLPPTENREKSDGYDGSRFDHDLNRIVQSLSNQHGTLVSGLPTGTAIG